MRHYAPHHRVGVTLVEALVIILIGVVLLAVLLPAPSYPDRGFRVAAKSQLANIASACASYDLAFNAFPGPIADASLNENGARDFTGSENMVLGLLGGVVPKDSATSPTKSRVPGLPANHVVDLAAIAVGPRSDAGRQYGAFYSPKPNELGPVKDTVTIDNEIPEVLDAVMQMPILYYRVDASRKAEQAGPWYDGNVSIGRETNGDYFNAASLTRPDGEAIDQTRSLLRADQPGGPNAADQLLTDVAKNRRTGKFAAGALIISPGPDGVYFSADDADGYPESPIADVFDDLWTVVD